MDTIVATRVESKRRLSFLPKKLPTEFLAFEQRAYSFMSGAAAEYTGGYWEFYDLSNEGFYIAPTGYGPMKLFVASNSYEGTVSEDAAGIIASLFALNYLCWKVPSERMGTLYYALRDFAAEHDEARAIYGAID